MHLVTQEPPRDAGLAESVAAHHDGLVAEAIRHMARELHAYERARVAGAAVTIDRSQEWFQRRLGRCPTAGEVAFSADLTVEDVLDVLHGRRHRQS